MPKFIYNTQPALKFIPQKFNLWVVQIISWMLPLILRFRIKPWLPAGITQIEAENAEILAKLYQEFQQGKVRFLIAFRHPEVEDPLTMLYLLSRIIPRVAREKQIALKYPLYTHFMYERGMTIWAGDWLGWLFSCAGGIPIRRGKRADRNAIQIARELFMNGKMPIAVAPEGGTNGHSGIVSPLEPGVSQLGFWCVEDIEKNHRQEEVFIIPVGIKYSYINPPWQKINQLLSRLEIDSGLGIFVSSDNYEYQEREKHLYVRILRLANYLISEMEGFYQKFYHQKFPVIEIVETYENEILIIKLHRLMDTALNVCEQYFNVPCQGNFIDRCRKLEEAGWNYIYRDDITNIDNLSPLQKGLADWVAAEASLKMNHMRIAESFVAVTANYILENPTADRFAETLLLMFDMVSRIKDSSSKGRPNLGYKQAKITIGTAISVTERWQSCQGDKQVLRQGVSNLTEDLFKRLEEFVIDD
ncbi:1-acyl-sn-glycerol-3-phosphate acyltransferase [Anabaena sp. FACHB-1237]|uniref:lysophospholipid acyltransferase family protein n=1 Tax=Anabaena sp. FACHB-1237 TaxID=2692769 RepID=UPI0016815D5F|nr:1-acyl-sn-glycerol-3-phosphate acyltransferase [Anabaena sp. FACHB-1237]MBD2137126.1 1-acyl-sn-glycerol-3-phosphate acyltransferase [Anabaena sp. FACHB-1237]